VRKLASTSAAVLVALAAASTVAADPPGTILPDPAGLIDLPAGYSYSILSTSCTDSVQSTESGGTFPMPEDFDANVLFPAPGGQYWLLNNHELTEFRPGDFAGDTGKCAVDEQAAVDDGDSDAWGSVSRLVLAADGTTVVARELITTGLHNLCAANPTPWGTYVTNEEFPYGRRLAANDPQKRSGWAWEVDPATGEATKLTGMGWFSHEQADYVRNGEWWLSDDQGDYRFIYKFVPGKRDDLRSGKLYGLKFNHAKNKGRWIGPLDPMDPHADMVSRGIDPEVYGFGKGEGLVANPARSWIVFSESGATGSDPGRVWRFVGKGRMVKGHVLAEGDWVNFSRPDNLRYAPSGDLYIMEDHGSSDRAAHPEINANEDIWVLRKGKRGLQHLQRFANTRDEPTGPWFHPNGEIFYLSLQGNPSRVLAIRGDFAS
jgi:secreted PhoX family phosphatase